MSYRICITVQPPYIQVEEPEKWNSGQVHAEYPKTSGALDQVAYLYLSSLFGHPAPNMSLVFESGTGSVANDGSLSGCYGSVYNNQSDVSYTPVEYPISDFDKIDPVQVYYEGPLVMLSVYKVDGKESIVFADLLLSSLNSFDMFVWSVVVLSFFVFAALLFLRKFLQKTAEYSPVFETFTHLIGQDSTDYSDRSGRVISFIMTISFFLILVYYLNLMSTELVVVTKPKTINNYRDIINAKEMTVMFSAISYDTREFVEAQEGSIQEQFWKKFEDTHIAVDMQKDVDKIGDVNEKALNGKLVMFLNSLYGQAYRKLCCNMKVIAEAESSTNKVGTYGWLSSDPEGKQHAIGYITRQGMKNHLIMEGLRRLKGIFEAGITPKAMADSLESVDFGPITAGHADYSEVLKCM